MKNIVFFALTAILFSCSSVRYYSDHLEKDSYLKGTTYNVEGECQKGINRIQEIRVSNSLHKNFQTRGYERSDSPDILIQFFIKEERNSYLTEECNYYGRWVYGAQCSTKVVNYTEGSIIFDVILTNTQSIVWHGVIYGPKFDYIKNPDQKITQYVNELLGNYLFNQGK